MTFKYSSGTLDIDRAANRLDGLEDARRTIQMEIATREQFEMAAAKAGAAVEWHAGQFEVYAPTGKVWKDSGVHHLVMPFENDAGSVPIEYAYYVAIERMSRGLEDREVQP